MLIVSKFLIFVNIRLMQRMNCSFFLFFFHFIKIISLGINSKFTVHIRINFVYNNRRSLFLPLNLNLIRNVRRINILIVQCLIKIRIVRIIFYKRESCNWINFLNNVYLNLLALLTTRIHYYARKLCVRRY